MQTKNEPENTTFENNNPVVIGMIKPFVLTFLIYKTMKSSGFDQIGF